MQSSVGKILNFLQKFNLVDKNIEETKHIKD